MMWLKYVTDLTFLMEEEKKHFLGTSGVSIFPIMEDTKESNSDYEFPVFRFYLQLNLQRC